MRSVLMIAVFLILCVGFIPNLQAESNHFGLKAAPKSTNGSFDKRRLLLGPGLGFGAAQRAFSFNISPSLAYCFTENFNVGTTLGFNYFQFAEDYFNPITQRQEVFKHKYPAYSMSVFARYLIRDLLILNLEPEINNTKIVRDYSVNLNTGKIIENKTRIMVPSVLVGAGYLQRISQYGHTYLMACYDLLQNPNARYYQTLDFRVGIMLTLWQ